MESLDSPEDLVRLYVREGLRLFEDRLLFNEEKAGANKAIDSIAYTSLTLTIATL